ncbi:hypothetical protein FE236_02205 [Mariprofundus erugo]|uniref:hypothetical protein n=1 Tax=Mariprofundus erugo TaxID=2528639 RepID=UPI0010FF37CC|nr:hypothetical protein [Mariprofundus erugo]TLS77934.1 hypothetical protein FE236_02205 [Mariprofundus erugo]
MSRNSGISKTIYFNREEADHLANEADELGISFKDLIKAKSCSRNGVIQVVRRLSLGREANLSLVNIADSFHTIGRFFDDHANDDIGEDLTRIREKHDEVLMQFSSAVTELKKLVAGARNVG